MHNFIVIYKNDNQLEKLKKYFKENYSIEYIEEYRDRVLIYFKSHEILPILLIKDVSYILNKRAIKGYMIYIDKDMTFNNDIHSKGIVKYVDLDKFRNFKLKEMLN